MAVRFHLNNPVQLSAQRLFDLMIEPKAQEAFNMSKGALESRCTRSEAGGLIKLEIYIKEPSHEAKNKPPDEGTMLMNYDPKTLSCTWERRDHKHGKLVKVTGRIEIRAAGDNRCILDEQGEIAIKIPILGNRIAKKAAKQLEENHPQTCRQWEQLAETL